MALNFDAKKPRESAEIQIKVMSLNGSTTDWIGTHCTGSSVDGDDLALSAKGPLFHFYGASIIQLEIEETSNILIPEPSVLHYRN